MAPSDSPKTILESSVLTSPADAMLKNAITLTLNTPPAARAACFTTLIHGIVTFMAAHPQERPWTCKIFVGTDGSQIFRGGVGHSLVIDLDGRLWRARSYEDFETTYTEGTYEIETLTPIYAQMREYLP